MEQAARERLAAKREALIEQRDDVQSALLIAAIMACIVWLALGYVGVILALGLSRWLDGDGLWLNVSLLIALTLTGMLAPAVLVPRSIERLWQRHYAFISELLRTSDAGQLILQPERWERVHELLDDYPWLKLGALSRPHDLDAQVEFAADHWRALSALTRDQHGLRRAVFWGALTRLGDEVMVFLCNGCVIWFVLVIGAPFMYAGYVLFFPLTLWYVQNQAAQVAVIDFLLE